jgi:ATP-dependent exoDNAse (exonuclease V) beta subunit
MQLPENQPNEALQFTWQWRSGCRATTTLLLKKHLKWINPLQSLVSRATKTLAVEIPLHYSIAGVGSYAGSCDGLMLVKGDVVLIDYKTKRPGSLSAPNIVNSSAYS